MTIRLAKDRLKVSYAQSGHSRSTLLSSILNLMHYGLFYDDDDSVWYYNSPVGKHTLSQTMASISKKSKLSKLYTNHSIRASTITSLDHEAFEARHIMRTSGYKSEASIRNYSSRLRESKKREISSTLSRALCDQ